MKPESTYSVYNNFFFLFPFLSSSFKKKKNCGFLLSPAIDNKRDVVCGYHSRCFYLTKYDNEMFSLQEIIKKSLLIKESFSATPPPNLDATPKTLPGNDSLSKTTSKRWNQANLGYFNPHLDRAYGEDNIVSVEKNVDYRNIVFFVQRLQSLVTFRSAALIKANIATSLRGFALKGYTS